MGPDPSPGLCSCPTARPVQPQPPRGSCPHVPAGVPPGPWGAQVRSGGQAVHPRSGLSPSLRNGQTEAGWLIRVEIVRSGSGPAESRAGFPESGGTATPATPAPLQSRPGLAAKGLGLETGPPRLFPAGPPGSAQPEEPPAPPERPGHGTPRGSPHTAGPSRPTPSTLQYRAPGKRSTTNSAETFGFY